MTSRRRPAIATTVLGTVALLLALLSIDTQDATAQAADGSVTVTLLHNNDGESKLLHDAEAGFPGIARFAQAWIDEGRSSDADILLRVSAGDNFLASKEFSAGLALPEPDLYDSLALRGLYEAMSLGNHDFDFGPEVTARFVEGFQLDGTPDPVTFVAANVDFSGEPLLDSLVDEGRIARSTVWTDANSGEQIGIIGALTPRLANISSPRNVVVDADVAGAVNAEAEALAESGVNRIVLVSHLQGLSADRELIPQLSNVDVVVAGGGDELLKNDGDTCLADEPAVDTYPLLLTDADGNEVPVVTAPGGYRCFGRLDITFDANGQIESWTGSSVGVPVDGQPEPFALEEVEQKLAEDLDSLSASVLGESTVDLDGQRTSVRTGPSNLGELLADSLLQAGQAGPDFGGPAATVAIQNGGGIRNDSVLPAGVLSEATTFDVAPFANFVVTGEVSRERFKEVLEVAVTGLPEAQGTFPQIAGFSMEVDASREPRAIDFDGDCATIGAPGDRIRSITLDDGTEIVRDGVVVPGAPVALATIDFLANGGDCYPLGDLSFAPLGVSYQQALSSYIGDTLGGQIRAEDYPEGGSRSVITTGDAAEPEPEPEVDEAEPEETAEPEPEEAAEADANPDDALAKTGSNAWLFAVIACTIAAAGAMIAIEANRAGWLSLSNRLHATEAWHPDDEL